MRCRSCLQDKPDSAFYVSNRTRCKECVKAAVQMNRLAKIDYYRAYDRQRASDPQRVAARKAHYQTDAFRISHAISTKKYDVTRALRKRATSAVSSAIRTGAIEPQPCFVCGESAQAHHPDYSAPLAVSWLCSTHHAQLHKEHREYLRQAA